MKNMTTLQCSLITILQHPSSNDLTPRTRHSAAPKLPSSYKMFQVAATVWIMMPSNVYKASEVNYFPSAIGLGMP
jgi:hypothetical protein